MKGAHAITASMTSLRAVPKQNKGMRITSRAIEQMRIFSDSITFQLV